MAAKEKVLYYLSELSDYKIASKDPDVRGWDVKDSDNRVIGKVDDLLVNKEREQVVYLDVEVDKTIIEANHDPYGTPASADVHEYLNKDGENHIIIPVGLVSLNEDQKFVFTDRINHQTFAETKRIRKGSDIERHYEINVLESYDRFGTPEERTRTRSDDWYDEKKRRDIEDFEDVEDVNYTDEELERRRENRRLREEDFDEKLRERDPVEDDYDYDIDERRRRDHDTEEDLGSSRRSDAGGTYGSRRRGRIPDDDSFYDRREFDRTNYRRRK